MLVFNIDHICTGVLFKLDKFLHVLYIAL